MLGLRGDANISSGTMTGGCSDPSSIYIVENTPNYRQYDWNTKQVNTTVGLSATPTAIVLIGAASAVITYSSARVSYIDVASNGKTDVTTNALATFAANVGQQLACDPINHIGMATSSTNAKVVKIGSNFTLTQLSPSAISGSVQASCVLFKADSSTFLFGTNNGKIFEMDSSGNVLKTINLVNTPNLTAPTITITGLSYANDILACTTGHGLLYFYQYSTSTIKTLNNINNRAAANPVYCALSDAASGTFLIPHGMGQPANATSGLTECYMASGYPTYQPFYNEAINSAGMAGIEPTTGRAWAVFLSSQSNGIQLRTFNITSPLITTEPTRSQNPVNVDVPARIIRIRDDGIGKSCVEIDLDVAAGSTQVACTNDHQYIELSRLSGSSKWDIREFQA